MGMIDNAVDFWCFLSLNKMIIQYSSRRWFETPKHLRDVTVNIESSGLLCSFLMKYSTPKGTVKAIYNLASENL